MMSHFISRIDVIGYVPVVYSWVYWSHINLKTNFYDQHFCKVYKRFYPLPLAYGLRLNPQNAPSKAQFFSQFWSKKLMCTAGDNIYHRLRLLLHPILIVHGYHMLIHGKHRVLD